MTELIRARSDDLECRSLEDSLVILDLRTEHYLSLNRAGSELWPLLVAGTSREVLVQALCDRYDLDAARAGDDVDTLLGQLRGADLLQREGTGAPAER